ncbi:DMT family transporter [Rhizobium sp. ARZ01]|uniref:DMT family transporter n=1 Tax=Rhizobium sp. ARZ01 TaxID=2769313 RepID=UPI001783FF05|nr:DMT family transporter [Rhizobium sp. ARZ01]MBD9371582.1 DMT family transporter [Rhizobium sp. ARZ01]
MSVSTFSPTERTSTAAGYAGAIVTVLIWATWVLATRHTASTSLTTVDVGLLRYGVPAIVLAPIWVRMGLLPKGVPLRLIVMMVAGAGALFFQVTAYALHSTPAAAGGILLGGSMPLATAVIGIILFGERPDRMRVLGLLAILAGLAILLGKALFSGGMTLTGFALLPFGGLLWAGYTHAFRRSGLTPLQGGALITSWSTFIHLGLAVIFGTTLAAAPLSEVAVQFTSQGILSGLVATFAYGTAIRALGGTQAAAFTAITPVLVTLGGGLLLGEPLGMTEMAAAVVTGAGVALSTGILSKRA